MKVRHLICRSWKVTVIKVTAINFSAIIRGRPYTLSEGIFREVKKLVVERKALASL